MPPIISNQIKPDRDEVAKYSKEGNGDGGDAFEVELHHHLPTLAHCQSRNCFWMSTFEFNICRFARFYTTTGGVLGVFLVLKSHIVTITVQAKVHTYKIDWKITFLFVCIICAVAKHTFPRYGLEKGLRVVYVHSTLHLLQMSFMFVRCQLCAQYTPPATGHSQQTWLCSRCVHSARHSHTNQQTPIQAADIAFKTLLIHFPRDSIAWISRAPTSTSTQCPRLQITALILSHRPCLAVACFGMHCMHCICKTKNIVIWKTMAKKKIFRRWPRINWAWGEVRPRLEIV